MGLKPQRLLAGFYLATPALALPDLLFGAPIRASFIADESWRIAYYVVLCLIGCAAYFWPSFSPVLGLTESSVSIAALIFSVMIPIIVAPAQLAAGEVVVLPFTGVFMVNFILSSAVMTLSFHRNEAAIGKMFREG